MSIASVSSTDLPNLAMGLSSAAPAATNPASDGQLNDRVELSTAAHAAPPLPAPASPAAAAPTPTVASPALAMPGLDVRA